MITANKMYVNHMLSKKTKTPKISRRAAMMLSILPSVDDNTNQLTSNNMHVYETKNKRFTSVVVYEESPEGHCVIINRVIRWRSFQDKPETKHNKVSRELFMLDGTSV